MALDDQQLDFDALMFPGRKMLYISEVADRLQVTERHVRDLIDEGKLGAINIGGGNLKHWRVPTTEFEKFLRARSSFNGIGETP
jgi:excisionase family DNA binding protein